MMLSNEKIKNLQTMRNAGAISGITADLLDTIQDMQERLEKCKVALGKVFECNGYMFVKEALEAIERSEK
jgi:DNA anti-recombination protein RmuC